jgi:broad specificity phosphatase PhoE
MLDLGQMDVASLAAAVCAWGGPAAASMKQCIQATHSKWAVRFRELRQLNESWAECEARLERAVEELRRRA